MLIVPFVFLGTSSLGNEENTLKSRSGELMITQQYRGKRSEVIRFQDPEKSAVPLPVYPWPGNYKISPDESWIVRTQKTGSGESIAILYRIEKNGRISEILGFDDLLWNNSDAISQVKKAELYHTGVESIRWAKDSANIEITLRGSNASQSGAAHEIVLVYDLAHHTISQKPTKQ